MRIAPCFTPTPHREGRFWRKLKQGRKGAVVEVPPAKGRRQNKLEMQKHPQKCKIKKAGGEMQRKTNPEMPKKPPGDTKKKVNKHLQVPRSHPGGMGFPYRAIQGISCTSLAIAGWIVGRYITPRGYICPSLEGYIEGRPLPSAFMGHPHPWGSVGPLL